MKDDEKLSEKVQELFFEKILAREENSVCSDCSAKGPRWASLSFGSFICMRCAGPHRALGPLITKVKSVKLDTWTRGAAEIVEKVGNKVSNDFWEYRMPIGYRKPTVGSSAQELERFVQDKYVKRSFCPPDFLDPVTEYLDAKRNGTEPKTITREQREPKEAEPKPEPQTEKIQSISNPTQKLTPPTNTATANKPVLKINPTNNKKTDQNLLGEEAGDLLAQTDNHEWGPFVEAQNPNPPLTPKITASASIMAMYSKPMESAKETVNPVQKPNQQFPINHNYMNTMGSIGGYPMNNMSTAMNLGNGYNMGNNMNMGNPMNNMMMANNFNIGSNNKQWTMNQMYPNNMSSMGGMGFGGQIGMVPVQNLGMNPHMGLNSNQGGLSSNQGGMGSNQGGMISNQGGLNSMNSARGTLNDKKVDIMNLYNNSKADMALSGNEMQMKQKANGGQENIMGMYSGKNFNVW